MNDFKDKWQIVQMTKRVHFNPDCAAKNDNFFKIWLPILKT